MRLGLFDVEIYDLEVLHILEALLLHHSQHLRNTFLRCPDKDQSAAHQTARLQLQLLKFPHGLALLPPIDVNENGL